MCRRARKSEVSEGLPLVPDSEGELPRWVTLCEERGRKFRCFYGHPLVPSFPAEYSGCYKCHSFIRGRKTLMLWCQVCKYWGICADCARRPRLPALRDDPLFFGRDHPCLLRLPPRGEEQRDGHFQVWRVICPGGNYEFLVANEAQPVADWLSRHRVRAFVLRYRLLPRYDVDRSLEDPTSPPPSRRCGSPSRGPSPPSASQPAAT
ncbi:unnamed protein product [Prorocentrum cordatum]|uniref:Uncharacterized protein n=1 Tax=Prorocentrum cordatum TaxID=2364126 RepID=A0ABN9VFX1_9DINO|nr:unnamed protein product [Polarella glacialis]